MFRVHSTAFVVIGDIQIIKPIVPISKRPKLGDSSDVKFVASNGISENEKPRLTSGFSFVFDGLGGRKKILSANTKNSNADSTMMPLKRTKSTLTRSKVTR